MSSRKKTKKKKGATRRRLARRVCVCPSGDVEQSKQEGKMRAHSHCPLRCSRRFHHPANKSQKKTQTFLDFLFFFNVFFWSVAAFPNSPRCASATTPSLAADSSPSLANEDCDAGERSDKYCMSGAGCAERLSFSTTRPVCGASGSRKSSFMGCFSDRELVYRVLSLAAAAATFFLPLFKFPR